MRRLWGLEVVFAGVLKRSGAKRTPPTKLLSTFWLERLLPFKTAGNIVFIGVLGGIAYSNQSKTWSTAGLKLATAASQPRLSKAPLSSPGL